MPKGQDKTVKDVADGPKPTEATVCDRIKHGQFREIDTGEAWHVADADLAASRLFHQTTPRPQQAGLNGHAPEGKAQCRF